MVTTDRHVILAFFTRVFVCLLLLAAALGIYSLLWRTRPLPALTQSTAPPGVLVLPAQSHTVRRQWSGYGTATAMDSADVPARIVATVVELPDDILPGAVVEAGQLLVRLDDSDFTRQVEITTQNIADLSAQLARLVVEKASWERRLELADEEVTLAKAEYDRVKSAYDDGAAKQREVDQARSALLGVVGAEVTAREELDKLEPRRIALEAQQRGQESAQRLAQQNVERCSITSPLSGVLQLVDVEEGENLAAGQRVARVVSLRRIEVPLRLPAGARTDVTVGDEVRLRSTGSRRRAWAATIRRIAPEDDETRTVAVYVEVEQELDTPGRIAPGMFLQGTVTSRLAAPRWIVPRRSVRNGRVMLVKDGMLTSRTIDVEFHLESSFPETGITDTQWLVLETELDASDLVLLNASRAFADGTEVTAVPVQSAVASRAADGSDSAPRPIGPAGTSQ